MFLILQLAAICIMFLVTYIGFLAFGAPKKNLLFTREEKNEWDNSLQNGIGKWFTVTNIVGTLTSLATTYLFFIGNSKFFGWIILICPLAIWGGGFITNYFTKKILTDNYIRNILSDKSQTIAVVAKIFWRPNNQNAIKTSRIVKWVSLINICAVIWLEFALFSDIASRLFNITNLECKILFIFITSFLVVYFTVKFGLRGFVFADFFQSPIIGVSALCLITGCAIAFFTKNNVDFSNLFHPINSYSDCGMFAIHVIFVNFFFVLVTEGHWLRIWIFGQKETQLQIKSLSVTSVIWLILILIGLLSFVITGGKSGESAIVGLLQQLHLLSPVFIVFFWLGGVAALFACADSQIFSFLIVNEFDYKSGQLKNKLMDKISPFPIAMAFACFFSIIYCILRVNNVPFEKIVFIVMPLSLNTLPAFVRAAKGYSQKPKLILLSIICYLIFSIIGLFQPNNELAWTLIAAAWPLFFSLIALINFNINEN